MRRRPTRGTQALRRGFTLLELMLVLAILVVLAGVVGVNIFGAQDEAYAKTTETQLQSLKQSIAAYRIRTSQMPESLEALVNGPSDPAKKAKFGSPIIEEVPKDAWGNEISFTLNGSKYELRSAGADGQANSDDDVVVTG
jgi:general secretion pathway protein G